MLKVYFDNMIASGRVFADLGTEVMEAVREIDQAHVRGAIKRVTSKQSWNEQARTQDPMKRSRLEAAREELSVVPKDHQVLGYHHMDGPGGTESSSPILSDVVDEDLYGRLRAAGLHDGDARHLMYASLNSCDRFLTTDPDFLGKRSALEACCGAIRIVAPAELVDEIRRLQSEAAWPATKEHLTGEPM